jgi:diguanylate cyclase (GGDEF)-like protein
MEFTTNKHECEPSSRLSELAIYDPLTGLQNRSALKELFTRALGQAIGQCRSVGVLYIDLNDFRAVNKLHGQAVGDVVISRMANRLRSVCEEANTIVRMDGDEFLIVSEAVGPDALERTAQIVVKAIREPYVLESGKTVRLSGSCGTAVFPEHGESYEELIAAAELALQRAKKIGADVVAFDPEMLKSERKRLTFEHNIGIALDRGEISIVFQPQAYTDSGDICGFETLARWNHPEFGSVSPADFIPAAEASGAICAIGAFVLREACKEAASWPFPLSVAVNVSPAQIETCDFLTVVKNALAETGLEPRRLELEVTESLFINNMAYAAQVLAGVKELGVSVSLDDFGTGYSSLATLRAFPFDRIKIDRSFVFDMVRNADAAAIVNSVLGLGRAMRLTVIAEGVESEEQRNILRILGCQCIQGYLIGKPMPAKHYTAVTGSCDRGVASL